MEDGVYGEHGVDVPRSVVVARGHDLDHVTIQLLLMPIAKKNSMTRHNVLNQHAHMYLCYN